MLRLGLIILAAIAAALGIWSGAFGLWPGSSQEGAAEIPLYVGGAEEDDEVAPDAFGPGPTVCSMDPRYRPKPGTGETCPVIQ